MLEYRDATQEKPLRSLGTSLSLTEFSFNFGPTLKILGLSHPPPPIPPNVRPWSLVPRVAVPFLTDDCSLFQTFGTSSFISREIVRLATSCFQHITNYACADKMYVYKMARQFAVATVDFRE